MTINSDASSSGRPRIEFVDAMRALAALFVICDHGMRIVWPRLPGDPLGATRAGWIGFATEWMQYGHFAVSLFIVLSGFCLMLPVVRSGMVLRSGTAGFYLKRARRILPTYYAALAVSLLLIYTVIGKMTGTQWDACLPVTAKGVISRLLLLQDVWIPSQINNPFWSIAVEWRIYFLFPFIVLACARFGAVKTTLSVVLLSAMLTLALWHTRLFGACPQYIGLFAVGMLAAVRFEKPGARGTLFAFGAAAGYAFVAAVCAWRGLEWVDGHVWLFDYVVGASSLCALKWLTADAKFRAILSARPLVFVGSFSYSVYLIHFPLQQVVWQYLLNPLGLSRASTFALLIGPGTCLILCGAYVFFLLFERPFVSARAAAVDTKVVGLEASRAA